ncbi:MAG: alpha/beta hydrolase [Bacteriovoracaceae bacterium]|nr:alpha/beta hydrolase [Bacteriovoracaceae bacterium]
MMNIFLLRGLIREAEHWKGLPEVLKLLFPQDKIFFLETPGTGKFYLNDSPLTVSKMVDSIRQQFLAVPNEPSMLISISLGGMIAGEWVHRYPDDFKRAVIINASFKNVSPLWHRMKPNAILVTLKGLINQSLVSREKSIVDLVCNNQGNKSEVLEQWIKIATQRPVSRANAIRQLVAAGTFSVNKKKPVSKVLVLASKGDRMVDYRCSEKIAKHWGAPLELHEWGGHSLAEDDPQWVASTIKKWAGQSE